LFCLLDPGQIRYRAIYTHPNQIPGYASVSNLAFLFNRLHQARSSEQALSSVK